MKSMMAEKQEFDEAEVTSSRDELNEVKVKYEAVKVKYHKLLTLAHDYESKLATSRLVQYSI